jgi:hypothetical protein
MLGRSGVLPRRGEYVSELRADTTAETAKTESAKAESAKAESAKAERCPWCDIFVRSAAGMCTCNEACGCLTCPARNADDYTPPPVPKFARPVAAA